MPSHHYIHISISASSVTCSSSTTKKHYLNMLSSKTNALLTHTLASFWRKQSCCPYGVWCRGLATCLQYVGPLFGYLLLNNSWAVGLTCWIVNSHYFICILTYIIVYVLILHIIFWLYLLYQTLFHIFIKCSCSKTFHRRSLYTFYDIADPLLEDSTGDWFEVSPNRQSLLYCKMDQMHLLQACIFAICF